MRTGFFVNVAEKFKIIDRGFPNFQPPEEAFADIGVCVECKKVVCLINPGDGRDIPAEYTARRATAILILGGFCICPQMLSYQHLLSPELRQMYEDVRLEMIEEEEHWRGSPSQPPGSSC